MVYTPVNTRLLVERVRAGHVALGANSAVKREPSDRLVDQVNGIFIANVGDISTLNGAVSLKNC